MAPIGGRATARRSAGPSRVTNHSRSHDEPHLRNGTKRGSETRIAGCLAPETAPFRSRLARRIV